MPSPSPARVAFVLLLGGLAPAAARAEPPAGAAPPVRGEPRARRETTRLRSVEFRDIHMGNVVAYTMLVPEGWESQGHIEWSNEPTPYPQLRIRVSGPNQSRIVFSPAMKFSYAEATPEARRTAAESGVPSPIPDTQGVAPPSDLGAWVAARVKAANPRLTDVRLVSDVRDADAERDMAAQSAAVGGPAATEWQMHRVTIVFREAGVPFTEEFHLTYAKNPWVRTQWMNLRDWAVFVQSDVAAPTAAFDGLKPLLYAAVRSLRSVPKWWAQQQQLLMEITRENFRIGMEEIRRRGEHYDRLSDANLAAWKRAQAVGDAQQNARINAIYEVQDFRDVDGLVVKLPIHCQHYYSDGKGNYVMVDSLSDAPGDGWTRIEPLK